MTSGAGKDWFKPDLALSEKEKLYFMDKKTHNAYIFKKENINIPNAISYLNKTFINLIWKKVLLLLYKYFTTNNI